MNKAEIKDKWLKELRSGKHKQTTGTLVEEFEDGSLGYCCLGVLTCKVLGIVVAPQYRIHKDDSGFSSWITEGDKEYYSIIENILEPMWRVQENDFLPSEEIETKSVVFLTSLNDDYENSFEEIADQIEKYWKV